MRGLTAVVLAGLIAAAASATAEPVYQELAPPEGLIRSEVAAVSADGCTVVGLAIDPAVGDRAVRWFDGEPEVVPAVRLGARPESLSSVSATGDAVTGSMGVPDGFGHDIPHAFAVDRFGVGFEIEWAGLERAVATAMSDDASTVVGQARGGTHHDGVDSFRFRDGEFVGLGHVEPLPDPRSLLFTRAADVSADGSVVVGTSRTDDGDRAFRWEDGVIEGLDTLPGGGATHAAAVSADGSVIVGSATVNGRGRAVRWVDGVVEDLGFDAQPLDVSADGSVVVGRNHYANRAFVWDPVAGYRELSLREAVGVSADGATIVGNTWTGGDRAWVVQLEERECVPAPDPELPPAPRPTAVGRYERPIRLYEDTDIAGLLGAGTNDFWQIDFDREGNAYLSDTGFHLGIVRVSPDGEVSEFVDSSGGGLWEPNSYIRIWPGVHGFYAGVQDEIWDVSAPGSPLVIGPDGDGRGNPFLREPRLHEAPNGVLAIVSGAGNDLFLRSPAGNIEQYADFDESPIPIEWVAEVIRDGDGSLVVAGWDSDNVVRIAPDGSWTELIGPSGDGAGNALESPSGLAIDRSGNLYVPGARSDNVFRVTPSGAISEVLGPEGVGPDQPLEAPIGVELDSRGNAYVVGYASENIFRIPPQGPPRVALARDEQPGSDWSRLRFGDLSDYAVDPSDNLWVVYDYEESVAVIPPTDRAPACSDGLDNDDDGAADYPDDADCAMPNLDSESPACADGFDNDGDGAVDGDDDGCLLPWLDSEDPACANGVDDDGDGLVDHPEDPGCASPMQLSEAPNCDDGFDNDDDGLVDHPEDPGCASPSSMHERTECSDGEDNDGDGEVDAADPQCASPTDPSETCGLGAELALLLPGLMGLRRLRRPRAS